MKAEIKPWETRIKSKSQDYQRSEKVSGRLGLLDSLVGVKSVVLFVYMFTVDC